MRRRNDKALSLIPDEIIAEVLSRTDIVAYVGRHVDLRKAGTLFKGLCPFHNEKRHLSRCRRRTIHTCFDVALTAMPFVFSWKRVLGIFRRR